ncbi:hypothetical protein [Candidatus Poriferisocius sp.]|uniref:hypothetical protein n=1 Tax=Candidatus Poriferisocius sp. TaxID=3101276 RepID=UPI003B01AC0E
MSLVVLCPLRMEARAARAGIRRARPGGDATVICTGMGPERSRRAAPPVGPLGPVAVVGMGGAVVGGIQPGEVVVATQVSAFDVSPIPLPGAALVAGRLRNAGFAVHAGPVISVPTVATGRQRRELADRGAVVVDMESAWLLENHRGPATVVRVVTDTPRHELRSPAVPARVMRALRTIRRLMPVLIREVC